jgi:hypothetical protein
MNPQRAGDGGGREGDSVTGGAAEARPRSSGRASAGGGLRKVNRALGGSPLRTETYMVT